VRITKKGKMKVEEENMDESEAVYPWTLSAVIDSDFLRNSKGGGGREDSSGYHYTLIYKREFKGQAVCCEQEASQGTQHGDHIGK
jgi:hypothetical protein